jgi:hypothetical protein
MRLFFKRYLRNVAFAIDQLANAILLGDPDETISSRLGKWQRANGGGWRRYVAWGVCSMLHWIDRDHCRQSIEEDEGSDTIVR